MNQRHFIWIGMLVGSAIGGWIPALWGAGMFSFSGIIGTMLGGFVGIFIGLKFANW
ncbi:MAG: hypothetical protein KBC33_00220 [Candidatus Pacebacteria bacterium]|nr:hypothetical protein [Candidatus Paceibacterota bacterium]